MKLIMHLNNEPFLAIKNGTKTIERRVNDEKRQKLNIGDIIEFINRKTNEILTTEVVELHKFKTFAESYDNSDKISIGCTQEKVANQEEMSQYYDTEEVKKYGVIKIKIKKI